MSYVLPALKVHQEFEAIANATDNRLYACIIAPNYGLHRYSEEDEKAELGAYDPAISNVFTQYPDKTAGSSIDVDYNRIFVEDGVLEYHSESMGSGSLLTDGGNKFRSSALVFKTANGVSRSGVFGTRDVQIGDPIKVTVDGDEFDTVVAGLIADIDAATVQAVPDLVNSPIAQAAAFAKDISGLTQTTMDITEAGASDYRGLGAGVISEVYTLEVLTTSGGVTGTTVKVTSASGLDDVASTTLALLATAIGTRGLLVDFVAGDVVFSVGDIFTISIDELYALPVAAASGTYTGAKDTQYIVTVVTGGTIADAGDADPVLQITTTNGADSADPVTVSALGNIAIGNYGVVLELDAGDEQLIKGASFTIDVTAEGEGAVKTIAIAENLTGKVTTDTLEVDFRLEADFELEGDQWTSDESSITVIAGAAHTNTYLGTSQDMDIISGDLFIQYRELLQLFAETISSVQSLSEASLVCGPAVVDNPLGLLVNKALTNSNGVEVYFVSLAVDSDSGYGDAIDSLTTEPTVYSLVPYSNSLSVRDAVKAHCLDMSTPEKGRWRIYWVSAETDRITAVYTELASGGDILGEVTGNTVSATDALFVTNGTEAGDTYRTNYSTDAYGNVSYDEYVIDSVDSEEELTLLNGPEILVPIKAEIWRESTKSEYADDISTIATHSNHRRGYAIWSEPVFDGDNPDGMPISAVCAALAGLRSGAAPHQPLTNVSVAGFSMERSVNFRSSELNTMAGNGVWLVVQTLEGQVYNRHQVSTDNQDINHREQTITTNLDHISRDFKAAMSDFYGRGNVSPSMLRLIRYTAEQQITVIQSRPYSDTIGPQILSAEITKLQVNEVLRDAVDLVIEPVLPYPLNNLDVYFIIS